MIALHGLQEVLGKEEMLPTQSKMNWLNIKLLIKKKTNSKFKHKFCFPTLKALPTVITNSITTLKTVMKIKIVN